VNVINGTKQTEAFTLQIFSLSVETEVKSHLSQLWQTNS